MRWTWTISPALVAAGLYCLAKAFPAYDRWQENIAAGDLSAAEVYEIEMWLALAPALVLIIAGAWLAGRWSRR